MTGQRLVVVAGSINMDIVASVARHPQPGETVVAARHRHMPGGKGANQAVAAARAGATVRLLGALGDDLLGDDLLGFLERSGVGVAGVRRTTGVASGTALCVVDADGRNTIVVVLGANASIDEAAVVLPDAAEGAVFVAQYEIPVESTVAFLAHGRKVGATCILNPAPANPTPADALALVDVLVLNETELTNLTGATVTAASSTDEIVDALRALRAQGLAGTAIVTLGGRGALALIDDDAAPQRGRVVHEHDADGRAESHTTPRQPGQPDRWATVSQIDRRSRSLMARPVIIDTDIGNDIDDTWALAMALRSPELDVRLVTASTGDPLYRGALVADLLAAADRPDIPIGIGSAGHSDPHETLRDIYDPAALDSHPGGVNDGVQAMIAAIQDAPEPVTVLALGPLTTVAAVLMIQPEIAGQARLVGMQGSYRAGYRGERGPVAEYNVAQDVVAARQVFAAPWTCTLAPLDTCAQVMLRDDRYRTVREAARGDRLLEAVLRHQRTWFDWWGRSERFERETGVLFDTVAVHLSYDQSLVDIEEVGIVVSLDGVMHTSPEGPTLRLASQWRDQDRFLDHLTCRMSAASPTPRNAGQRRGSEL
jgi:ribokinase